MEMRIPVHSSLIEQTVNTHVMNAGAWVGSYKMLCFCVLSIYCC